MTSSLRFIPVDVTDRQFNLRFAYVQLSRRPDSMETPVWHMSATPSDVIALLLKRQHIQRVMMEPRMAGYMLTERGERYWIRYQRYTHFVHHLIEHQSGGPMAYARTQHGDLMLLGKPLDGGWHDSRVVSRDIHEGRRREQRNRLAQRGYVTLEPRGAKQVIHLRITDAGRQWYRQYQPVETTLTAHQAAERLGYSERRIRSWCVEGHLKATRHGDQWRITETDLEAWRANPHCKLRRWKGRGL